MLGECKRVIKKKEAKAAIEKLLKENRDDVDNNKELNTTLEEVVTHRKTKRGRACLSTSESNLDSGLSDID